MMMIRRQHIQRATLDVRYDEPSSSEGANLDACLHAQTFITFRRSDTWCLFAHADFHHLQIEQHLGVGTRRLMLVRGLKAAYDEIIGNDAITKRKDENRTRR